MMMKSQDYKVYVNDDQEFIHLDIEQLDAVTNNEREFHILKDGISYRAEILEVDYPAKQLRIKVNGSIFDLHIADPVDQMVDRLGLADNSALQVKDIKAPMPGLVLSIDSQPGQEVQKGDTLLILEAMKMENVIKAPGDGKIKEIKVNKGQPVDKNQLLVTLE